MPEPIVFKFQQTGQKDIENAFKSIASSSEKSAKTVIKDADAQARALDKLAQHAQKAAQQISKARVDQSKKDTESIVKDYQKQVEAAKDAANKIKSAFKEEKGGGIGEALSKGILGGLKKLGSMAGGLALGAAGLAVGTIGAAARESMKLQEMANRLSIAGRGYGKESMDATTLRKSFEATALATPGTKAEDVAAGTAAFVSKTGNLKMAQEMQGTFATVASATGSKIEDIANAAADLMQKFDITTVEDMQNAFAKLTFQGKEGAFELKDAANQFGKLTAAASRFNIGKGQYALATLGGLTQIARTATGSAESASTSVESMFAQLVKHSPTLKGQGVNVFGPGGAARNIQDVLAETITNVGKGNLATKKMKLEEIFGEQGIRAVSPLISAFETGFTAKKKGGGTETEALAAGQEAIRKEFDKTINVQSSWNEMQKDSTQAQTDVSAQLTHAWEELKSKVGVQLMPALSSLATKLVGSNGMTGAIDPFIDGLVKMTDVMSGVADFIEEMFPTAKKVKVLTPEEEFKKSKKEYEAYNKIVEGKGADVSNEDISRQNELLENMRKARETYQESNKGQEDFVRQYTGGDKSKEPAAINLARVIQKGRFSAESMDMIAGTEETSQQKEIRTSYNTKLHGAESAEGVNKLDKASETTATKIDGLGKAFDLLAGVVISAATGGPLGNQGS